MTMIFLPDPIRPGAPVAFDVALEAGVLRVAGTVEGVSDTHVVVRLANRMLVSVERASVHPCEREDAA